MSSSSYGGQTVKVDLNNYVSKNDLFDEIKKIAIGYVNKRNPHIDDPFESLLCLQLVVNRVYGVYSDEHDFISQCLDVVFDGSFVGPVPLAVQS